MKNYFVELTGINESHVAEEEIDISSLKDDEIAVENTATMISAGTELSRAFALKKGFKYPVRPGYCSVGKVIGKGKNVSDVEIGDKVFHAGPHSSIAIARRSNKNDGNMYFKLPEGIDDKQATAINMALIAISGVNIVNVKINDVVAIFGLGNIGLITALIYKKFGCRVVCLDPVEKRCELARACGIEETISLENQIEELKKLYPDGADVVVDATGASPVIVNCVNAAKKYGQVVLLGSPRVAYECDVTPMLNTIHMKDLKVLGALNQTAPVEAVEGSNNSIHKNFDTVAQFIMNKDIDISKIISHVMDPKDCQKAYHGLMNEKDQYNCVVFDWSNYH